MNENLELHAEIQAKGQRDRELREKRRRIGRRIFMRASFI
jgi:hypothetical protein